MSIHPDVVAILKEAKYNVDDIPVLNIGERMGSTGYVDFIKSSEMTSSVMKGVDHAKRAFVSFDIQCDGKKEGYTGGRGVITCFQRYTDDLNKWCIGGDVYGKGTSRSSLSRYPLPIKWLKEMLTGKNRFRLADQESSTDSHSHDTEVCENCFMWMVEGACVVNHD